MSEASTNSYDELPYPGSPFPQTHPDRLATIGRLFGMQPPAVDACRVLELGCTDGGNLIPMAIELPGSEFVGIDLSQRQIDKGLGLLSELQLSNITLLQQDIMDLGDEHGQFDYVIAHGVFSWVPREVQDRIFEIIRRWLTPQGIAYVSYNTYPGWHMRGMLRDMMLFHTRQFSDATTRIEQARALINFLAESVPGGDDNPYRLLLTRELESMQNWADSYIYHESLETHNEPLYFHQFVERAGRSQLRFLGEANFGTMLANDFPDSVAETLGEIGRDIVEMEQYMDFVRNRLFRQTLLCHEDVSLDRRLNSDFVADMYVRSFLRPMSADIDLHSGEAMQFQSSSGVVATAHSPLQKAAFWALATAFPQAIHFPELLRRARSTIEGRRYGLQETSVLESEAEDLRDSIFKCFCDHLIDLRVSPTPFVTEPGDRPLASPLARLQAEPNGCVTTLGHDQVKLDTLNAHLLWRLDGEHDRAALIEALRQLHVDGTIVATRDGEPIDDPETIAGVLEQQLDVRIGELAGMGLLLA
ncbi:tRNA (guanine-N(7)-)-methyltransferase [Maioricimonas rarisocia]|uniref:tRNA (Guanine-N(7)-)-methyltransferase n=1 Tax=Maioricimonas rarisocia TaxID=2528026 RepID=A0A517ZFP0_9PLAN|nr:class I SAM-dependent methyltransferase [Maioricimonas rarisocia]QDU41259.1 tRNA (guanine-N(7)-)-methyltransferase [Maioricimonas rarisocia]